MPDATGAVVVGVGVAAKEALGDGVTDGSGLAVAMLGDGDGGGVTELAQPVTTVMLTSHATRILNM